MPAPTSANELLELTQKSGIIDEGRLTGYIQQIQSANGFPQEANKLAGLMVRDGLLTFFQAEQLLLGKWKRFTIGKYRVLEKLGSGGMGQVFLCEHKMMRRRVAIKVLPAAKADDPSSLERFYREARAVAALDHPNIVRAYDIDKDDNLHFLVMEYVDGTNLQDIIKKTGPMDPLRACHYVYQAAQGLEHAFDQAHLVHRDIKPGNILIDRQGEVKILDMGLARFFHDEEDLLTKKYDESVLGTADYLAPEQAIDSHSVDIRADIYSLGATFYFMLSGQAPFTEGTVAQKLIWHQTKEPKPILAIRHNVPNEVVAVVERMMMKDPKARPQQPKDVADLLAPLIKTPIPPPPESEMPRLSLAATGGTGGVAPNGPLSRAPIPTPTVSESGRTPTGRSESSIKTATSFPPVTAANSSATAVPSAKSGTKSGPATVKSIPPSGRNPARPGPSPAAAAAAATAAPPTTEESSPVWSSLTAETPNPKIQATVKSPVYKPPSATLAAPQPSAARPTATGPASLPTWVIILALGVLLGVLVVGAVLAFGLFGSRKDKGSVRPGRAEGDGPQTLVVDAAADANQPNSFHFVWQALVKARPGDRILVRGNAVEEQWTNVRWNQLAKGVTIEPDLPPGQYLTWKLPASAKSSDSILELVNAENLTFRRFEFDGQNAARTGIYVTQRCPGVTFEDIRIKNCTEAAIKLINAVGSSDHPVKFTRVRVLGSKPLQSIVTLHANPKMTFPANENILIQDCLFEGPSGALVMVNGSVQGVEFDRNRFATASSGVVIKKPAENQWFQLTFHANTFYNVSQNAVTLEGMPVTENAPPAQPKNKFTFTNNFFANCKGAFNTPDGKPWPDATIRGNARDAASSGGNSKGDLRVIDYKFLNLDANSPGFLRYPRGSPLDAAPGGPFGAPPE
jgi:serine/threonine protein kinase